ncbi:nucleic acid/nucleotide deaminase domain-containing protein [Kitasatospora sp. NPDC085879]|uniref:nucleic acid/nucleotide deaminase domain-containing protein n=1 Tax=Kitasatospora sp. NPDC085879 TaxID=3154769 RepID=UPI0034302711
MRRAVLRTGPGYSAAVKFLTPQGEEMSEVARSGPGLPHPEWQLRARLEERGIRAGDVLQLYGELQVCDVPGGNCAAQVLRWWPQVKVSHSAEYGASVESRQRGMAALRTHLVESGRQRGFVIDVETRRLPLSSVQESDAAVSTAPTDVSASLGAVFPPFFEPAGEAEGTAPLVDHLIAHGNVLSAEVEQEFTARGYVRIGSDYGREICVTPGTGEVWAVGRRSGRALYVNRSVERYAGCLELLRRAWPQRVGLGPADSAGHTAEFQHAVAALDGTAFSDPENWWSVILEQHWDGLL